jgi:hypothetical protein
VKFKQNALQVYALRPPFDPPHRETVSQARDVEMWLDVVAGRNPRDADGSCRDDPPPPHVAAERLLRLPASVWQTGLFQRMSNATLGELGAWSTLVCRQSDTWTTPALGQAWTTRWLGLTRTEAPGEWSQSIRATAHCPQVWAQALPQTTQLLRRQPWRGSWLSAREDVQSMPRAAADEVLVAAWQQGLEAVLLRDLAAHKSDWRSASDATIAMFNSWAGAWPGLPTAWDRVRAAVDQLQHRPLCPLDEDHCATEPSSDAWQSGETGWALFVEGDSNRPVREIWAMHWENEAWSGPWFVGPMPGRNGDLAKVAVPGTQHRMAPEDTGKSFAWRVLPADPGCNPAEAARLSGYPVPAPVLWADITRDSDGDGLNDRLEVFLGLDPHQADTDGDGRADGVDPSPTCARKDLSGDARTAAVAAGLFMRRDANVLHLAAGETCVDVPTSGGPIVPFRADGANFLHVESPPGEGEGVWKVIELGHEVRGSPQEHFVRVVHRADGWHGWLVIPAAMHEVP